MSKLIYCSVHNIVDSVLRGGSINTKVFNIETMNEGNRLHNLYQSMLPLSTETEVNCDFEYELLGYKFKISGRADLVDSTSKNNFTVVEIKTTIQDIDEFYNENEVWHLGQAVFYAYSLCIKRHVKKCNVKLLYISQRDNDLEEGNNLSESDEDSTLVKKKKTKKNKNTDISNNRKEYEYTFTIDELVVQIENILLKYIELIRTREELIYKRDISKSNLKFPFDIIRDKQQTIIDFCYENIENKQTGYIEASTGIGKTVGVLYPYINRLLGNKDTDKIFYLTSKNSLKDVCLSTLQLFEKQNVYLRVSSLYSKDRLCINEKKRRCNPEDCKYAKDYYNKMKQILTKILVEYNFIDMNLLFKLAEEYEVCPFELQLDLSNFADIIIGDYNYVFDPKVKLQRFFANKLRYEYYLLIDEAHNLPSRVRDTYSEEINIYEVMALVKECKGSYLRNLKRKFIDLIESFVSFVITNEELLRNDNELRVPFLDLEHINKLKKIQNSYKDVIKKGKELNDDLLNFYMTLTHFLELPHDEDSKNYAYFYKFNKNHECISVKISCLDSKEMIVEEVSKFDSTVMFSATLQPFEYFLTLLGKKEEQKMISLKSDFINNNLMVLINPSISTRYKDRDSTLSKIYYQILSVVLSKVGNYFIFLPSYEYLQKLYPFFSNRNDIDIVVQGNEMSEEDRKEFLNKFVNEPKKSCLGFIVLGGIFSEGIDLTLDRLIGAIIISVGLPKLSVENDALMEYYSTNNNDNNNSYIGYNYAYIYPGIGKVLQAAGRVIRSERDKGIIFFIDDRYKQIPYNKVLNSTYKNIKLVLTDNDVIKEIKNFWEVKK